MPKKPKIRAEILFKDIENFRAVMVPMFYGHKSKLPPAYKIFDSQGNYTALLSPTGALTIRTHKHPLIVSPNRYFNPNASGLKKAVRYAYLMTKKSK